MKKLILAAAAASVLASAAPAAAQARGSNFDNRIEMLRGQMQNGIQRGTINRAEAMQPRGYLREANQLERQYSRGGFTRLEQQRLHQRVQWLQGQIRAAQTNRR